MKNGKIKNIIFDWHGVISDDKRAFLQCVVNNIFKEHGLKTISLKEMRKNWEAPYMRFFNKYMPDMTLEEERKSYKKAALLCPAQESCKGMVELLHKFRSEKINMAVLSAEPKEIIEEMIIRFGLNDVFNEIVVNIHDKSKIIADLIIRNNFNVEETIFIGDSTHEVEVGRLAGIKTGAVTWGVQIENKLRSAKPDFIMNSVEDLEEVILGK